MLGDVVREYLERFSNIMTESVYASKGLEDYSRMKRYCDYLDYDRTTLFRQKGKTEAGLRNIGNTCYLNVILQLLFHINYLREKIFTSDIKSELIQLVKILFAEMSIGRLAFADPSDLFEHLRSANPEIFISGVQNDFHEIFTVLIDRLSEGYKDAAPEEARVIRKLLFGRMATRIDFVQGRTTKVAPFNIINLDVTEGSFQKAFDRWRYYKIQGYQTPKGNKVTASAQNIFVETPSLMAFFINRVTYRNNALQKDTRAFQFQNSILIQKSQQSELTKPTKISPEREKQCLQQKSLLQEWLIRVQNERSYLIHTLKYLRAKEAPLLSAPQVQLSLNGQIDNTMGESAREAAAAYLEKELELLDEKTVEVKKEVAGIQEKLRRLEEQGNYETYLLWAVMIHQGTSAISGHYKVCININDTWFEYNDRIVTALPQGQMEKYKEKGQICCLFYRRPNLICDNQRTPITLALKNAVNQHERETRREIDKARLLQALYQETESANILLQHEIHYGTRQYFHFFFRPIHYALSEGIPLQACRGIMVTEAITSQTWRNSFSARLVSEDSSSELAFPRVNFGIPEEYFAAADTLKAFLTKQALLVDVPAAYEQLAGRRLKLGRKAIKQRYVEMLEIIVMKGLYYLRMLPESGLIDATGATRLSCAVDKILQGMDHSSEFVLVAIAIKSSIRGKSQTQTRKERSMLKTITIDNFGDYFCENFRFWIKQREILSELDELNFFKNAPILPLKE